MFLSLNLIKLDTKHDYIRNICNEIANIQIPIVKLIYLSIHLSNYRSIAVYRQNELDIEKYIDIELSTTNIDIENFPNIVQPYTVVLITTILVYIAFILATTVNIFLSVKHMKIKTKYNLFGSCLDLHKD